MLKKALLITQHPLVHYLVFAILALGVYLIQHPVGTYHLSDDQIVNINWYMVSSGLTPSSSDNYMAMESLVAYFPIQLGFALKFVSSYERAFALLNILYFLAALVGIYHLLQIATRDNFIALVGSVTFVFSTITFRTGDWFSFVPVSSALARNSFFSLYILLLWYIVAVPHTGLKLPVVAVGLAALIYIYPLYVPVLGITTLLAMLIAFYRGFEKRALLLWLLAAGMLALAVVLPYLLSLRGQFVSAPQSGLLTDLYELYWGGQFQTPFSGLAHFILDILKSKEKAILFWFVLFIGVVVTRPGRFTRFFLWCAVSLVMVNFLVVSSGSLVFQTVPRPTDEMNRNYLYVIPFILISTLSSLADLRENYAFKLGGWRYYVANSIFLCAVFMQPLLNTYKHIRLNDPVMSASAWFVSVLGGEKQPRSSTMITLQSLNSDADELAEYIQNNTSPNSRLAASGWLWYRTQRQVLFDTKEHPVEAFVALHNEDVLLNWRRTVDDFYQGVGMDPYDESGWPFDINLIIENAHTLPVDYLVLEKFTGSVVDGFAFRQVDLSAEFNVVFENQLFILVQFEKNL